MSSDLRLVYMTAGTSKEARLIGEALVAEQLAACVNLIDGMNSIYRWEGEIQHETETVIIAKTNERLVSALTDRVKALHSYDCPCVVSVPIDSGNAEFLNWISNQVKPL
jgi:periplasmic divalent cation tolerance protein